MVADVNGGRVVSGGAACDQWRTTITAGAQQGKGRSVSRRDSSSRSSNNDACMQRKECRARTETTRIETAG